MIHEADEEKGGFIKANEDENAASKESQGNKNMQYEWWRYCVD